MRVKVLYFDPYEQSIPIFTFHLPNTVSLEMKYFIGFQGFLPSGVELSLIEQLDNTKTQK